MGTEYGASQVKEGDRVYWPDYGNGQVVGVVTNRMVIRWQKEGLLWHDTIFARHLVLVERAKPR